MGNLGPTELIVIMAIALVVFGPKKLPEIGKGIGNALREFNKARNDFMDTINSDVDHDDSARPSSPALAEASAPAGTYPVGMSGERKLEYPEPPVAETAEALPYGSDFHAVEGDSQPSFRTAEPEPAPVATAANTDAHAGERRVDA